MTRETDEQIDNMVRDIEHLNKCLASANEALADAREACRMALNFINQYFYIIEYEEHLHAKELGLESIKQRLEKVI